MDGQPVLTLDDFRKKYGAEGAAKILEDLVRLMPKSAHAEGGLELATKAGILAADIETIVRWG